MRRLMLGSGATPSLLVEVTNEYSRTHFDFEVVNGWWRGTFTDGYITIYYGGSESGSYTDISDPIEILTDNQDRLRGDYNAVFDNFDNPRYIAPSETCIFDGTDDDIPF
jgi:hypothetical protein